jgi:hypothetical protein
MKNPQKFIQYLEVWRLLGEAMFKDEFVNGLTWRERWILEETGFGTPENGYQPDKEAPVGPLLALPEVGAARAKLAFMYWQMNGVQDWLAERGIQIVTVNGIDMVDRSQFQKAWGDATRRQMRAAWAKGLRSKTVPLPSDPVRADQMVQWRRPRKWDWYAALAAYAAHLANDPDGLPKKQADAEKWVQKWFITNSGHGDAPPITEIRTRVAAPIYNADRKARNAKA